MILMGEFLTRLSWREMRYSLTRRVFLDFVVSIETCFVSWEIITLFLSHGKSIFALFCFLNLLQRAYRSNFYTGVSCPYAHLLTFIATWKDPIYKMTLQGVDLAPLKITQCVVFCYS